MTLRLAILGTGLFLPPTRSVREMVQAAGGDPTIYRGWERAAISGDDDHPGTMGARALQVALEQAQTTPRQLDLVVSVGMSRDYPPSWSVAAEWMRQVGAGSHCLPIDLTLGCMGILVGLEMARTWLAAHGGGRAAVVAAEKIANTVDRADSGASGLWGHADGAGAIVVESSARKDAFAEYVGSAYSSASELNGAILVKYGGTRFPMAPPGVDAARRTYQGPPRAELWATYEAGYRAAFAALRRFTAVDSAATRLVCNQISPNFVKMIAEIAAVPLARVDRTGADFGHVGSVDAVIGLSRWLAAADPGGSLLVAASTPYAFGAGLIARRAAAVAPGSARPAE